MFKLILCGLIVYLIVGKAGQVKSALRGSINGFREGLQGPPERDVTPSLEDSSSSSQNGH